jgi:hypothetical protein
MGIGITRRRWDRLESIKEVFRTLASVKKFIELVIRGILS